MTRRKPFEILRDLRLRTGLTQSEIARRLTYKSPSGYNRWERPEKKEYEDNLIPYHVIQQLMPVLVGKGHPPVTHDELLAISDAKSIPADVKATYGEVPAEFAKSMASRQPLEIRYRVERGVYIDLKERIEADKATAPILPSSKYPSDCQFAVNSRGVILHCVEPKQVSASEAAGKRAILAVEREMTGLVEVVLGRVVSSENENWRIETAEGKTGAGMPLGVVLYSYNPEI